MPREINLKNAKCTSLKFQAPVELKSGRQESDFVIEAYTGQPVERWWGKLAIAVDGIRAKKQIPVFRDHMSGQIVGYSNDTWKDGSFFVSGKFSGATDSAKEVKALAQEGFPWQASIGVRPLKIMSLEEGGEGEVNGKKLKGPAEIWLQSEVFETSFVPLGADDKTNISVFSIEEMEQPAEEVNQMPKEITIAFLKENHPDMVAALIAEAVTAAFLREKHPAIVAELTTEAAAAAATSERERIQAVLAQSMPGHEELVNKLAFDGETTEATAAVQILAAEKEIRKNAAQKLGKDGVIPLPHAEPPAAPADGDAAEDENAPIEERAKATWDKDSALRAEFDNDYDCYLAFRKAEAGGHVRILSSNAKK